MNFMIQIIGCSVCGYNTRRVDPGATCKECGAVRVECSTCDATGSSPSSFSFGRGSIDCGDCHGHGFRMEKVVQYPQWIQSWSGEDFDRMQGLASDLTDADRAAGRPAPTAGYSKQRCADARRIVKAANRYASAS